MSAAHAFGWRIPGAARARWAISAAGAGEGFDPPLVAILCAAPRARVAAAGLALALARVTRRPCGLAGAVGEDAGAAPGGLPTARRGSVALQRRGLPASASGRLVWLADRRGELQADDVPARCAALSAELGRSAAALGVPAAVAFPCTRTDALDRVLAWHDAIVVVREPDAPPAMIEHALASLARLGRPAGVLTPPARLPGGLAIAGVVVPAEAASVVAELVQAGFGRPGGWSG